MNTNTISIKNLLDAIKPFFYMKINNGKIEFSYENDAIKITEKFFDSMFKNTTTQKMVTASELSSIMSNDLIYEGETDKWQKIIASLNQNGFIITKK